MSQLKKITDNIFVLYLKDLKNGIVNFSKDEETLNFIKTHSKDVEIFLKEAFTQNKNSLIYKEDKYFIFNSKAQFRNDLEVCKLLNMLSSFVLNDQGCNYLQIILNLEEDDKEDKRTDVSTNQQENSTDSN